MKKVWEYLRWFSASLAILFGIFIFVGYMAWEEYRMNTVLVDQALKGNPYAVRILMKYDKPQKFDKKIIYEALEGNQYALEILKIDEKSSKDSSGGLQ